MSHFKPNALVIWFKKDIDGNPYIIRYNKVEDTHYLASEKEGKKTGNTAAHDGNKWTEATK